MELGNLTNLEVLNLSDNGLVGELPPHLVRLANQAEHNILYINNTELVIPPSKDRDALVALHDAEGGSHWQYNKNWLRADRLLREWDGVITDSEGRVTLLILAVRPRNSSEGSMMGAALNVRRRCPVCFWCTPVQRWTDD